MTTASEQALADADRRNSRRFDVVVIGGGQAGLATAWHLAQQGLRYVVLEANEELGGSWRARWDSLTLFTPSEFDALPGLPFPAPAGTYPGKDAVAGYLRDYAGAAGLTIELNAPVSGLDRSENGFLVRTADRTFAADQVVVATGPFQVPVIPTAAAGLADSVVQVHSADYRNPRSLPEGPALVVGGGNSGFQIAEELAADRPVDLSIGSENPLLPQRPLGRDLFWWLTRLRLIRVPAGSRLGRRMQSRGEFVIGTSRRQLEGKGVRIRPRLVATDGRSVTFADGSTLDVDAVVWATGYRSDYSWIDIPTVLQDGRVVHRRGVTDVPGLYFVGLAWQHTRGSALLGFVDEDATHLARLARRHRDALDVHAREVIDPD
jgi:putative flavoprotein involved in K+ transport